MKKGSTLIELLVVIAAIGILLSVVFAGYHSAPKGEIGTAASTDSVAIPEPTNYAIDTANVLSADQLASLNQMLKGMDTEKHQFAVLVVKTTQPLSSEQYGIKVAEKWKVGKKGLDNGAIIIVATEDRKIRLEVGYGLEGDVNDATAGDIIRNDIAPKLKTGDWSGGIVAGLNALSTKVK